MKYCRKCKRSFEPRKRHHYLCRDCWYDCRVGWRPLGAALPGPTIPPEWLKRLMQLSHPDKHANSKLATETFQWLNQQRS